MEDEFFAFEKANAEDRLERKINNSAFDRTLHNATSGLESHSISSAPPPFSVSLENGLKEAFSSPINNVSHSLQQVVSSTVEKVQETAKRAIDSSIAVLEEFRSERALSGSMEGDLIFEMQMLLCAERMLQNPNVVGAIQGDPNFSIMQQLGEEYVKKPVQTTAAELLRAAQSLGQTLGTFYQDDNSTQTSGELPEVPEEVKRRISEGDNTVEQSPTVGVANAIENVNLNQPEDGLKEEDGSSKEEISDSNEKEEEKDIPHMQTNESTMKLFSTVPSMPVIEPLRPRMVHPFVIKKDEIPTSKFAKDEKKEDDKESEESSPKKGNEEGQSCKPNEEAPGFPPKSEILTRVVIGFAVVVALVVMTVKNPASAKSLLGKVCTGAIRVLRSTKGV